MGTEEKEHSIWLVLRASRGRNWDQEHRTA